jgi:hypothetical protein
LTLLSQISFPQCTSRTKLAFSIQSSVICFFCGIPGHLEKDCHKKKKVSEQAKRNRAKMQEKKTKEAKESTTLEQVTRQLLNLQAMQVYSLPLIGSRPEHQLTGTLTQVPLHT